MLMPFGLRAHGRACHKGAHDIRQCRPAPPARTAHRRATRQPSRGPPHYSLTPAGATPLHNLQAQHISQVLLLFGFARLRLCLLRVCPTTAWSAPAASAPLSARGTPPALLGLPSGRWVQQGGLSPAVYPNSFLDQSLLAPSARGPLQMDLRQLSSELTSTSQPQRSPARCVAPRTCLLARK